MNPVEIGKLMRARRDALGLSRERLARLSGRSGTTIRKLENGTLGDLDVRTLDDLLDLVGLQLETGACDAKRRPALQMASRMISVSYRRPIDSHELAQVLASGKLPADLVAHISTFLDETPLSVVVSTVEEAALIRGDDPRRIWRHLIRLARELRSPRLAWT